MKIPFYREDREVRDTAVPVTQCNELCIVTVAAAAAAAAVAVSSALLEDHGLLDATGSRHTTQPAHAGVGGHHTTVSPLFFIAYPQTQVPAPTVLGPCAVTAGARSSIHYPTALKGPSPALGSRTLTQYLEI